MSDRIRSPPPPKRGSKRGRIVYERTVNAHIFHDTAPERDTHE